MLHRFSSAALPSTAWKNGAGRTRPIAVWPGDATMDDFAWRASLATLDGDADFSTFAGVDRSIVLIDGDDATLTVDGESPRPLVRDVPFAFAGECTVRCSTRGTSTDFNAMSRRDGWAHAVRVVTTETTIESAMHGLLMALAGTWTIDADSLAPGDGVWWVDRSTAWRAASRDRGARLLAMRCGVRG